jgi:4-methylaminobutanoate oxidase (formaldehyde-forming)
MEKGYRTFGTDLTMRETPFDAGLGAFVRLEKGAFMGSEALSRARDRASAGDGVRLRTVVLAGDGGYLPVYGGEAVRVNGEVVGGLRSAAYGPTIGRMIGSVYLDRAVDPGAMVEVDVFDQRLAADLVADVLVDPRGERMRS